MQIDEFEHALKLGLGRAVQFVNGPLAVPYSEAVLEACLRNRAYDPQCEGDRARYMLEIVRRTANAALYTDQVLASLAQDPDSWDAVQRFTMARLLASEGDDRARNRMVDVFPQIVGSSNRDSFAEEFIHLDGIDGLLFVAERIGALLRANTNEWTDDALLRLANEALGKDEVARAVRGRAETNADVRAYLEAVAANSAQHTRTARQDLAGASYKRVRAAIQSGNVGAGLPDWGVAASPSELEQVAKDLVAESSRQQLLYYLRIFGRRAFPLDCEYLIRLTKEANWPIAGYAFVALGNVADQKVRRLALALGRKMSPDRDRAIGLLVQNFRAGDHGRITKWCEEESEAEILHGFTLRLERFFEAHPNHSVESRLLTSLYARQPCSNCRNGIVRRLIELNALPDEFRAEAAYDSLPETRELVAP